MSWGVGWGGITPSETDLEIANNALHECGQDMLVSTAPATAFAETSENAIKLNANYCVIRDRVMAKYCWNFAVQRKRLSACGILDCSARTITFIDGGAGVADTITDSEGDMIGSGFESGDIAAVSGSVSNNFDYKVRVVEDGGIILTLEDFEEVTAEVLTNDTDLKIYAQPAYGYSYKYPKPADCLRVWAVNEVTVNDQPKWSAEANYVLTDEIDAYDQINVRYIRRITDATKFDTQFREAFTNELAAFLSAATKENLPAKKHYKDEAAMIIDEAKLNQFLESNENRDREETSWEKAGHS